MAINLGSLFGEDSAFRQLLIWQVGAQVVGAVLQPALDELQQEVYSVAQTVPISTPDLADLVVRGFLSEGQAAESAKRNGTSPGDFSLLVKNAAQAPDSTQLVEALRRKIIPQDAGDPAGVGFRQGIAEGHLDPKWTDMLLALGEVPIGIADAVDGVVESQISLAQGQDIAYKQGLSADSFQTLINIRGNPPGPAELLELVRRGVIPVHGLGADVTSLEQGIAEGATKNKWTPAFEALLTVLPPARSVTAMLHSGAITPQRAAEIWTAQGYDQATVHAFLTEASSVKTAAARTLAKSDLLKLYTDGVITRDSAKSMLEAHGWSATDAEYELAVTDLHDAITAQTSAVSKIKSLYIARKISTRDASDAMDALGIAHTQRDKLIKTWGVERGANVRVLTPAQIADAFKAEVITQDEAIAELVAEGYTEFDAWVILSIKMGGALPNKPGGAPSPGDRYP